MMTSENITTLAQDKINLITERQDWTPVQKIGELTQWFLEYHDKIETLDVQLSVNNEIEEWFGQELRRLDAIRERNLEWVSLDDIELLKKGYADLFNTIDKTLDWNPELKNSLEGVINRASLRAMLIDPQVSIKEKEEIMNHWEDYM